MSAEQATELEFLRYFYGAAGNVFGPADDDVYRAIADDFEIETGKSLPVREGRHIEWGVLPVEPKK